MGDKKTCTGCNLSKYIVNRTHCLCDDCNQVRLHGMNRRGVENKKFGVRMDKLKEKRQFMVYKKPIQKSEKQKVIDKKYSEVVKEILNEREPCCETCGKTGVALSISHTISRKRCKEIGRTDLITDKKNLVVECWGAPSSNPTECHNLWEVCKIDLLLKINSEMINNRLEFKDNDPEGYKLFLSKHIQVI